ncbi:MAG: phenylalanine-4-hydroxylase [Flavobacteriales bacterium]|nr:phenylalanine-4-hydroxylase [Flavobacteriales bacterium]
MIQEYNQYTAEDHKVWKILFDRQSQNLADKACKEYLHCLDQLSPALNGNTIPNFEQLNELLLATSGWSIEIVPGMIPVNDFFELLAKKKFCSSTWIRPLDKLDYLDEPDIFHDIFGHVPLLVHSCFSQFAHAFGKLGVKYREHVSIVEQLQRLYWFTIEFGTLTVNNETKVYGAGVISSYSETLHVLNKKTEIQNFNLDNVTTQSFVNTEIQQSYYSINNLSELLQLIPILENYFEKIVNEKKVQYEIR